MKRFILFILTFCIIFTGISFATSYPNYSGYVNDFAHVLSTDYISTLNAQLSDFNHQTTNQIAVVTVDSTQPETIEEYSIHLADKWKVGQKGKDNGVILLVAVKDHRMRIEVGRGLEGDLTDIQSKHIEQEKIAPYFKQGSYEQGITNGVNAITATITHNTSSTNYVSSQTVSNSNQNGVPIGFIVFGIIFLIAIIGIAFSPHTPLGGAGMWGIFALWSASQNGGGGNDGGNDGFGGGGFSGGGSSDSW